MSQLPDILERMIAKFARRAKLDPSDREALASLPYQLTRCEAGSYIVREGSSTEHCVLIASGLAFRHKLTVEGARQIVSIHIPGDFVDLDGALLKVADHNIQSLTRCEMATIPIDAILGLLRTHPSIAHAMWVDTLIDGSIFREWVMNVGRRDARQRLCHLFCEFALRLEVSGLGSKSGYELPMTQEQLADCTGLTPVHVNRTLNNLENEKLIRRHRRHVFIPDWERLRDEGGFNARYLHLDQAA
jgi:CRP-like cAMP-binding protein